MLAVAAAVAVRVLLQAQGEAVVAAVAVRVALLKTLPHQRLQLRELPTQVAVEVVADTETVDLV